MGDVAPDFELVDHRGARVRLSSLRGRPVILFFYPRAETRGCTAQVCGFRDAHPSLAEAGAVVLGVSSDTPTAQRRFAEAQRLPFRLLVDEGGAVRRRFRVPRTLGVLPGRSTYVIDHAGVVRHVFTSQLAFGRHAAEAIDAVGRLPPPTPGPSAPEGAAG